MRQPAPTVQPHLQRSGATSPSRMPPCSTIRWTTRTQRIRTRLLQLALMCGAACCRPGARQLVKEAWAALKPIVFPAAWLFIAHTLLIMMVDRFTHRTVNEGTR